MLKRKVKRRVTRKFMKKEVKRRKWRNIKQNHGIFIYLINLSFMSFEQFSVLLIWMNKDKNLNICSFFLSRWTCSTSNTWSFFFCLIISDIMILLNFVCEIQWVWNESQMVHWLNNHMHMNSEIHVRDKLRTNCNIKSSF